MTRFLYTLLWCIVLPLLPLRLWWRGRREPGYREHVGERFGIYSDGPHPRDVLWIHAVSLGETRAVAPLIERLQRECPERAILLTHMTATGRDAGRRLFGDRVLQAWLPYDIPFAMKRFLEHFRPSTGLLVETELWPNLMAIATRSGTTLLLVNARLSERSARAYGRVPSLSRPMLRALAGTAAQSDADAERLRHLGARNVVVTGNLKFDIAIPPHASGEADAMRARFGVGRPVLVLASTRDGEEALLLDALARASLPAAALVVIVPRHPQRFDEVAAMLDHRRVRYARRSANVPVDKSVRVVLGDSLGEMFAYYGAADVAFIGGSLLPLGGQNLIEPIAAGVPTLVGPHMFNFQHASDAAIAAGAAVRIRDADDVFATAARLFTDAGERDAMRARARTFMDAHRGAVDRLWAWLAPRLARADAEPEARISRASGG